jgi:hypothetical protein
MSVLKKAIIHLAAHNRPELRGDGDAVHAGWRESFWGEL